MIKKDEQQAQKPEGHTRMVMDRIHQYVQTIIVPAALAVVIGAIGFWYNTGVNIVGLQRTDIDLASDIDQLRRDVEECRKFATGIEAELKSFSISVSKTNSDLLKSAAECKTITNALDQAFRWQADKSGKPAIQGLR